MTDLTIFETPVAKSQWYTLRQNNSGGWVEQNDDVDWYVSIQAFSEEEAEAKFHSLDNSMYSWCDCCGERWWISFDVGDVPTYYGEPIFDKIGKGWQSDEAVVMHGLNGRKARFDGKEFKEIV